MGKYNVYTDGNGSDLILVQGMGQYVPLEKLSAVQVERDALAAKLAIIEADVLQREAQLILTAHEDPASKMSLPTLATLQQIGSIMMTRAALARAKVGA